jgi:membrane protein YqaA with SNARE-associated domain
LLKLAKRTPQRSHKSNKIGFKFMLADLSNHLIILMQSYPAAALLILGFACAISATILPFPSEALVLFYQKLGAEQSDNPFLISLAAGIGNTFGGLISYYMGLSLKRFLEKRQANLRQDNQMTHNKVMQNHSNQKQKKHSTHQTQKNPPKTEFQNIKTLKIIQKPLKKMLESIKRIQRIAVVYSRNSLKKFGVYILLFSWLPLIGDLLCFFAGYFRLPFASSLVMMFIGKTARYLILLHVI